MRWSSTLLLLLLACKPTPYQLGVKAAADGRWVDASEHWIQALDKDTTQQKPRLALLDSGPKAFDELLEVAQEHEASNRFREAVAAYATALAFTEELQELDLLEFDIEQGKHEALAVRERWADHEWKSAIAADEGARWQKAMGHYTTYRELRPNDPELDPREGLTWLLWAEDDLANKRYTEAAEHYRRSHQLTDVDSSAAWAGAIEVALGRYGLSKGKCRYAVEHFEAAGKVKGDPRLQEDLTKARDCARLGLELSPLEEQVELQVDGIALPAMLMDRIEREIERQGSRYLVLIAGESDLQPAQRFEIGGRVTQALVEPPSSARTEQRVEGEKWVECDRETLIYDPEAVCSEPVEVVYTLNRASQTVRLSGTVKIVDVAQGAQKTRPLEITLNHDTTNAADFMVYDGAAMQPVQVARELDANRIEVPSDVLALDREPEPLPSGNEVLRDAVTLLAEEAGRVVVEAVDFEEPPPEPTYLEIRDPLTLPGDLDFVRPTLAEPEEPVEALMEPIAPVAPIAPVVPDPAAPPVPAEPVVPSPPQEAP